MAFTTDILKKAGFAAAPWSLLLHLSLVVMRGAADECGTKFIDPSSSTVLAQIVVQGKVDSMMPAPHHSRTHSANVTIGKVYKGMDVLKGMGIPAQGNVMVDKFGPETDPNECIADMSAMTAEEELLFFLRPSSSHGVLQITALPLPAEHSLRETVEDSLCDSCVSPPEIQRVMCRQCAHAPVITKGKARKVRLGQRARLGCYARGKPSPSFSWTKAGVPINSRSPGITIRTTNTSSILIIRKTANLHRGQYTCTVENGIGQSKRELLLQVTKRASTPKPKYNVRNAPDKRVCDRVVCLNGGTCYYSPSLDLSFCKCTDGFEGVKCENDISGPEAAEATIATPTNATSAIRPRKMIQCELPSFCLNGGTCFYMSSIEKEVCKCSKGFSGDRCEQYIFKLNKFIDSNGNGEVKMVHQTPTTAIGTTPPPGHNKSRTLVTEQVLVSSTSSLGMPVTSTETPGREETFTVSPTSYSGSTLSPRLESSKYHTNVDDEALKIIRSRIANNDQQTTECSFAFSDFCLNGGTCTYFLPLSVAVCICPTGFTGKKCQTSYPEEAASSSKIHSVALENQKKRVSPTGEAKRITTQTIKLTKNQAARRRHSIFNNADHVACASTNTCRNGATCYYSITMARTFCVCPEGFEGSRCEKQLSSGRSSLSSERQQEDQLSLKVKKVSSSDESSSGVDGIDDEALKEIISRLKNSRLKARRCKSKGYCLNKGKCRYIHKLDLQVCLCRAGYTGKRCEHSK
ncbi:neuregulin 2b [Elysia marginata]|uniref:Neuregulin 2b n=1 Tax=Elysia marginata TaxID=1093978 RepID=A0AAV4HPA8_9GAST|nr:neuregulin 2b [Elysia marginata]